MNVVIVENVFILAYLVREPKRRRLSWHFFRDRKITGAFSTMVIH